MKIVVIKLHLQSRKAASPVTENKFNDRCDSTQSTSIDDLPDETMLKIFSYLNNTDKLQAAQVSSKWNELVYDRSAWVQLDISDWIKHRNNENDTSLKTSSSYGFKDIEYIDDSEEEYEDESEIIEKEVKLLQFWIKSFLPRIGYDLETLVINNCKSLNNNLVSSFQIKIDHCTKSIFTIELIFIIG